MNRPRSQPHLNASRAAGFTLIEVLLATVLLAAGLALAFTTIRAVGASTQRGEVRATQADEMRSVATFLRRSISGATNTAFGRDANTNERQVFLGDAQSMRFVADLPGYLGYGGAYMHDLHVQREDGQLRLLAGLAVVLGGQAQTEASPRAPEVLVEHLREVRFRYRGVDSNGVLEDWQEQWTHPQTLPALVQIDITAADGRAWPPLVIAVAQAQSRRESSVIRADL